MAGTIIVSDIKTDTDNSFVVRANTGNVLFRVTDTGLDAANSIPSGSITSDMIADGTVIAADVADGSITTAKIADGNITAAKIDTVANTQITGTITTAQIADSAITDDKIAAVANTKITGTITTAQIADGQITEAKLSSGAGSADQVLTTNGSGTLAWADASGGITQGTAIATTSGNSFSFTGIPSGTKRIMVVFNNFRLSNSERVFIRIGTSSGIETTGYGSGFTRLLNATVLSAYLTTAFPIYAIGNTYMGGIAIISNVSGNIWVSSHSLGHSDNGTMVGGGFKTLSGTLDRVQVLSENGSAFNAGSINILYE